MRPIPGRIPVFFVGKGSKENSICPQWLLLLLPLRSSEFFTSALSGYNNRRVLFWFGEEKKFFSLDLFSFEKESGAEDIITD